MRMISAIHVTFFAFSTCLGKFLKPNILHKIVKSPVSTTSLKSSVVAEGDCAGITKNFITNLIDDDLRANRNGGRVLTRFPPEPNGYLHLGHAKSICLNFGVAQAYGGKTNMRFDDTNPEKEEMEYINSIIRDVRWLINGENGTDPWDGSIRHASDYFEGIYKAAVYLIKQGLAYVDDLSQGNKNNSIIIV